jgi:ribosomal protein S18 acetylase RimI-like enzyme
VNDEARAARVAQPADAPGMAAALASAFFADPVIAWALPDAAQRLRRLTRLYTAIARYEQVPSGTTLVAEDADSRIVGVAQWRKRGARGRLSWRDVPFSLAAGRALGTNVGRMARVGAAASGVRPREPHWYLELLGVAADVQRGGFGSALVRGGLERVDADRLPAHLETTEENLAFYARLGFRVTEEIRIARTAPMQYSLLRDPVL